MVKDTEIALLLTQLNTHTVSQYDFIEDNVTVRAVDDATKLSLSTPVYIGEAYIPKSVRLSLSQNSRFSFNDIPTYLSIDEENFTINLFYLGRLEGMNFFTLKQLIENFSKIADEWRHILDDKDNQDRVYIFNKR